jgi:uncharacterized protein (TIRG00374 family)
MAASSISLLPAGLGVVDGTLILALSHSHLSTATATAGVLVYRLISVVLVTALGWAIWFALRTSTRQPARINAPADAVNHRPDGWPL